MPPVPFPASLARCLLLVAALFAGSRAGFAATRPDWNRLLKQSDTWFQSPETSAIAGGILSHQTPVGDWPKNTGTTNFFTGDRATLHGTFDNGATLNELRFLARAHRLRPTPAFAEAITRGVRHVLDAQYPNGGWPQTFPPGTGYARHITLMVREVQAHRHPRSSSHFVAGPPEGGTPNPAN